MMEYSDSILFLKMLIQMPFDFTNNNNNNKTDKSLCMPFCHRIHWNEQSLTANALLFGESVMSIRLSPWGPLKRQLFECCNVPPGYKFTGGQRLTEALPAFSFHVVPAELFAISLTDFPADLGDLLWRFDVKYSSLVSLLEVKWVNCAV